jgi:transposase
MGGEAGTRLLGQMQMTISARTLLRLVRTAPEPSKVAVRILGVDDWAMRKGRTYGTILVDLERHRPIDLLPDRSAATLAAWLRAHPEVKIITRDRSTEYARGASEGAPAALQVADRWHLLQNLRQMLERLIQRFYPALQAFPVPSTAETTSKSEGRAQRTRLRLTPKDQAAITASRQRAMTRYEQIQQLRRSGSNILQIAHQLKMGRVTVRKYFYADTFPERAKQPAKPSIIDPYLDYLESRHRAGCENAKQLWRELQAQGFHGGSIQVRRWLEKRRQRPAPTTPGPYRAAVTAAASSRAESIRPPTLPSHKQLAWLLMQEAEMLTTTDTETLQRICQDVRLERTYQLAQQFRTMVQSHQSSALDLWLDACATSGITDLVTFAAGIRQDEAAVRAALKTHWSNGQTEGQVNRLKFLKRQMYGRANFDLLRHRVLHPN